MTQYARPDDDTSVGNWTASSGSDLFDLINDASVDNDAYITVTDDSMASIPEPITFSLSSVTDPAVGTGHSVVVRAATPDSMSNPVTLNIELKDGSTSIMDEDFYPDGTITDFVMDLSGAEAADDISTGGYADLTLVITATDGMSMGTETRVYDAYFACPDVVAAASTPSTQSFSLVPGGAMGTSFSLIGDIDAPPKVRI